MSVQVIGWALVHSLWQGAVITVAATVALALARHASARSRYGICLAALFLTVAAPFATSVLFDVPEFRLPDGASAAPGAPIVRDENGALSRATSTTLIALDGGESSAAPGDAMPEAGVGLRAGLTSAARAWLNRLMPYLVALWLAGVAILSLRLAGGIRYTRRLLRGAMRPSDPRLEAAVRRLAAIVGVRRAVRVLETARGQVPLVMGWLKPILIVPASAVVGLSPAQLELILVHELAHIRRSDYFVNVLQTVAETLLFYHPAVWWLSARIREEREHCCDDIVLETAGADGVTYARALLAVEEGRGAAIGLAAAATGGSLMRRVRRLVAGEPARLDLGSRWAAGVIGVAAVAVAANAMAGAGAPQTVPTGVAETAFAPPPSSTDVSRTQRIPDSTRAAPSSVTRIEGGGDLRQRWRRAEDRARQTAQELVWVGYVVRGDPNGRFWLHVDRRIPVQLGRGIMIGSLLLDRRDELRGVSIPGVPLSSVVGDFAPYDIALLFGVPRAGGGGRVSRVHVGNVAFPVYFDRAPLVWLGEAGDEESLDLLRELDGAGSKDIAEDLVSAIGAHRSSELVVPALVERLQDDDAGTPARAEAAAWLGRHATARSLAVLAGTSRGTAPDDVRRESIEALAQLDVSGALDSLIALTRTLVDRDLRREAIEALAQRDERRAFDELLAIARAGRDVNDQREAVESIAESADPRRSRVLEELARRDASAEVRKEAVETLGEAKQGTDVIGVLESIALGDPDDDVRAKAVESLAHMEVAEAVTAILTVIDRTSTAAVRRRAVEALGESHAHEQAITALHRLAWRHVDEDVRHTAVEALGQFEGTRIVGLLAELAARHSSVDIQRRAAETLGNAHPHEAAIEALRRIVWEHKDLGVQQAAIEELGSFDEKRAGELLIDIARRHPRAELRKLALEEVR
jgi:beta-lactamase regulating signal transducer with metallopeptidase domain/HEAT repeat protein